MWKTTILKLGLILGVNVTERDLRHKFDNLWPFFSFADKDSHERGESGKKLNGKMTGKNATWERETNIILLMEEIYMIFGLHSESK